MKGELNQESARFECDCYVNFCFYFSYREDHEFEFEYEDWGVIEESAVSPRIL